MLKASVGNKKKMNIYYYFIVRLAKTNREDYSFMSIADSQLISKQQIFPFYSI